MMQCSSVVKKPEGAHVGVEEEGLVRSGLIRTG